MQVLRLVPRTLRPLQYSAARCVATTANAADISASSSSAPTAIPLGRVEALWDTISIEEKAALRSQLAEVQKKDWKQLSIEEKKAGEYRFHLDVSVRLFPGVHARCSVLCVLWSSWTPCTRW